MDPRLFAQILLRILAIYIFVESVSHALYLPTMAGLHVEMDNQVAALVVGFVPIIIALILWVIAPQIARFMIARSGAAQQPDSISIPQIQEDILAIAGFILVVLTLPSLVSLVIGLFGEEPLRSFVVGSIVDQCIRLGLGVMLVVGARKIVENIRKLGT